MPTTGGFVSPETMGPMEPAGAPEADRRRMRSERRSGP